MLFHIQKRESFFWNFILEPRFLGKLTSCPWNQPHFLIKFDKSQTRSCRRKTAEDDNVKINFSAIITCTFLLFKANPFLRIFYPKSFIKNEEWTCHRIKFSFACFLKCFLLYCAWWICSNCECVGSLVG